MFRPSVLRVLVAVCAYVLAFVDTGDAISCYVCDSSDNPSCADLKSNSSIVPEECSVTKMKSIQTWLFELNEISYFDTGIGKNPLMNCQKVVARNPNTHKMVTARFCQLDTGESDACNILRNKLRAQVETYEGHRNKGGDMDRERRERDEQEFHCSICTTDRCNGSEGLVTLTGSGLLMTMLLSLQQFIRW